MPSDPDPQPGTPAGDRRHCILGTAGHIDHGKSALVKALTGTDPDRLPEERARGMTIVLGFAHLTLPHPRGDGEPISFGIVDVPGHERFVRTMVAGATGVDLGMLVVAADDGVMPQTREHVEILDLLGVERGLIVLSKVDLVHADRIVAVKREIADWVEGTSLHGWPIVPASAKTGEGLDEVRATLGRMAADLPPQASSSLFRLAVDRVFSIRGRGTVVTGSVLQGTVSAGEKLELHPGGLTCNVREVQTHGAAVRGVGASQRAALNLTGLDRGRIERGMELATPGCLCATRYVDARVRILPKRPKPKPLISRTRVRVSMGTADVFAIPVVVGGSQIEPGRDALVQFQFAAPVVAAFGQRFIIRTVSAQATLGGGQVVRPLSRRFPVRQGDEIEALKRADSPDAFVRYSEAVRRAGFESHSANLLACEIGVVPEAIPALDRRLQDEDALLAIAGRRVHRATVEAVSRRALAYLQRHHANHPNEPGVVRDRFIGWIDKRSAAGCGRPIFARLEQAGDLVNRGPYVAHQEFRPALSPEDATLLEELVAEIIAAEFDAPAWTALKTVAKISRQRSKMLDDLAKCESRLVLIGPGRYMAAEAADRLKQTVRRLGRGRRFKLAEVRDALGQSRRVVQPMLEYLDRIQFTRRVGDERVLLEKAEA